MIILLMSTSFKHIWNNAPFAYENNFNDYHVWATENLKTITEAKRNKAASLREELTAQADQVVCIVNDMRSTLKANCNDEGKLDGCLLGTTDDFLEAFDKQRQTLIDQFTKTDKHWEDTLKSLSED